MDKYRRLVSNTLLFAISTFSSKILSFFLTAYRTRVMGTADYGGPSSPLATFLFRWCRWALPMPSSASGWKRA